MLGFVERAEVEVRQAAREPLQEVGGDGERRVNVLGMGEIEAETRLRQLGEDGLQALGRVTRLLARVHVLDGQPPPERAVQPGIADRVRVDHDRVDPRRNPAQRFNEPCLVLDEPFRRRMDADEEKRKPRRAVEVVEQPGKLLGGDRRQLNRDARPRRRFVD